jgi:hypothetical protein
MESQQETGISKLPCRNQGDLDNVIYMYEPTLETSKSSTSVSVYIEHHKAFIDESYIIDTIFDNLKEKDNE